jgi:epoxyqueuosine reductase
MNLPFATLYEKAISLGWDDVAVCSPEIPQPDVTAYKNWLANGYQSDLTYMENQVRTDPQELLPGATTAIMLASYYRQPTVPFRSDAGVVASYARGRDYHNIHRKRSKKLIRWLEEVSGKTEIARPFSDSSPIMERALAVKAEMAWFGKSSLLIHRRFGTFFLLSGILTTLSIEEQDGPEARLPDRMNRCGSCSRCIEACPTGAIIEPYIVNASLCLSNHLIESKDPIPGNIAEVNPGYILGCDRCQDVCPHNVRKPLSPHPEFSEEAGIGPYLDKSALEQISQEPETLYGTPLQRRKVAGLHHTAETLGVV